MKKDIQGIVEMILRDLPETRGNNDLVWAEVCLVLSELYNITSVEAFIQNTLNGNIPSSHSVAASISIVRKKYPELKPTEEQLQRKLEIKKQYINNYKNA
jgi:hypothetical protein